MQFSKEVVRVLRVLEYVGERDLVEHTLVVSAVPLNGVKRFKKVTQEGGYGLVIKSAMVGPFPEEVVEDTGPQEDGR